MNNFKKIGLTALAASLVSVSAHAGEMSVTGAASMNVEGKTGLGQNAGSSFTMSNQLNFAGSGELDNGLTVSLAFELDQGATEGSNALSTATTETVSDDVFDNHSVTVSSDTLGSLTFSGHGGSTASNAIDTSAAGDLWDSFDESASVEAGATLTDFAAPSTAGAGNDSFFYTSPEVMDGLTVALSYKPQQASPESATGYGINYTGVEGLSLHYAVTDINTGTTTTSGDNTVMKATYAYGPVTVGYSNMEHDLAHSTNDTDRDMSSWGITYTVSDELSISYGTETIESAKSTDTQDVEVSGISAAYTAGGMTISASMKEGDNGQFGTGDDQDLEYWSLGASFAF
jgi:outer membrane protein OmpU